VSKTLLGANLAVVVLVLCGGKIAAQESPDAWVDEIRAPQYFALYVEDVDQSVAWYRTVFGLVQLGQRILQIRDPDGNIIQLVSSLEKPE